MEIFQDGDRRHLGFLKFQIFNGRAAQEGRTASLCQISSKSVEPLPRYDDFPKMAAVSHLEFVMHVFGPPTKRIWRFLSLCKIWLESMQ